LRSYPGLKAAANRLAVVGNTLWASTTTGWPMPAPGPFYQIDLADGAIVEHQLFAASLVVDGNEAFVDYANNNQQVRARLLAEGFEKADDDQKNFE
jgi:hypothetical protein